MASIKNTIFRLSKEQTWYLEYFKTVAKIKVQNSIRDIHNMQPKNALENLHHSMFNKQ